MNRNILYAPDYIINAGGILSVVGELNPSGFHPAAAREAVAHIYDILLEIFDKSRAEKKAANLVADEIAEDNIQAGINKREGILSIAGKKLKDNCRSIKFKF